jgi:[acyl-carrier-protein] S-malonyltransferase
MGKELRRRYAVADRVFAEADEVLGFSISGLLGVGPEDELRRTANCQPAILAHSIAVLRVLEAETDLVPDVAAGHSLGEWSALVCAGALTFADALRLVRERGLCMQEAVPEGQGSMVAVSSLALDVVEELCREAARGRVVAPANVNAPDQFAVAGHADAVDRLARLAAARGARVDPLRVSAPFHCELMRPAAGKLRRSIETAPISAPTLPVLSNVDASLHGEPERIREHLVRQVVSPVCWQDCVQKMRAMGVEVMLEIGSRGVLKRLIERIDTSVEVIALAAPEQIEGLLPRARGEVWSGTGRSVDLARFSRWWRDESWSEETNGIRRRGDGLRLRLPSGAEWRFDDPSAHGF